MFGTDDATVRTVGELLDGAVVVVTGVMAAGKSTVAQALAERLPRSAHVRGDTFRRMVVGGRAEPSTDLSTEAKAQLRLRYRLAAQVADGYASAGFTAILQDIVLGSDLTDLVASIRARPRYVVVLALTADAVAGREAARAKTGYAADWQIGEFDRALRTETPQVGRWLDTSTLTVQETVDAILADLDAAAV